jgi:perosamine synthetase
MAHSGEKIPWFELETDHNEEDAILKVLASGYLNDGPTVREFERQLAARLGVTHAVAVTSGTIAISASLFALGIGPGDEVLVPDLTFIATATAVRLTGARVRLVDVEPERFGIDIELAREAIGPQTRAIVSVDVNGRAPNYGGLEELCLENGLDLVCDSAEALGSQYHGAPIGTHGVAACFSLSANKTVSSGQGGVVVTNRDDIHARLREIKDQGRRVQGTGGDDLHPILGFNFKYTSVQGAIAIAQLNKLDVRLEGARQRERWYREILDGCNEVNFPRWNEAGGEVLQWTDILIPKRDAIADYMNGAGIGVRSFWRPLHTQAPFAAPPENFPVSTEISRQGLWLPSNFSLTRDQVEHTAKTLRDALRA